MTAKDRLARGDPRGALELLQQEVRVHPADVSLRLFLFQLLCVLGQWCRAQDQLQLLAGMDSNVHAVSGLYRDAIACEMMRLDVFNGSKAPTLVGEPQAWVALMVEALRRDGRGERDAARALREQAYAQAPPNPGRMDGMPFEWMADTDMRLGPLLEAFVNGSYWWVLMHDLLSLRIEPPVNLHDLIWAHARLHFRNGAQVTVLLPVRYPGSETAEDGLLALARKSQWLQPMPGFDVGLGQRVLGASSGDKALLDIRCIEWDAATVATQGSAP